MTKRDVLDEKMARRFAWRMTDPEASSREDTANEASPAWNGARALLEVLRRTGAPPELCDQLLEIVIAGDGGSALGHKYSEASRRAVDLLIGIRNVPDLDARIVAAAEQARQAETWDTFESLVRIGSERGVAEVLDVAERAVNEHDGEPGAFGPLYGAARELEKRGRIDAAWILERLRRPESAVFPIAVHLSWESPSEEVLEALRAALGTAARGGAAAAEAAHGLIAHQAMDVDDPRLDGLLERAPVYARAFLAGALIDFDAPPSVWRRHVLCALLSPDDSVAAEVLEPLCLKRPEGTRALFEGLLGQPATEYVRSAVKHFLEAPDDAAGYWRDLDERMGAVEDKERLDDGARKRN